MKIYLIGFMGAGKTSIGKALANKLGLTHIDLDCYIEEAENATVSEIFATQGEQAFRALESKYLLQVVDIENVILSTGGGTPCSNNNMEVLKQNGITIYLKCSPKALANRLLKSKTKRPLIEGKNEEELEKFIACTLENREVFYNQANVIVDNPSRDVTQIINILNYYK